MKYSQKEMAALIKEVEEQFKASLTKSETQVENKEVPQTIEKTEEVVAETQPEVIKAEIEVIEEDIKEENKEEGKEEPKEIAKEEDKEEDKEECEEECDYDDEDLAEVEHLYKSMGKAELEIHRNAIAKACGSDMVKSEPNANEELLKNEVASIKKENDELKKNLQQLTEGLQKFVKSSAPKQKSITKIDFIKKSEDEVTDISTLSKQEISKRLSNKVKEGKLQKSETEAIVKFYNEGSKNVELIKHLL